MEREVELAWKASVRWDNGGPTCARLRKVVADAFGLQPDDLLQASRGCAGAALARQTAMYLARVSFGMTLTQAAQWFGRDRTTAAHACRVVEDRRDDPAFEAKLAALETMLQEAELVS